MKKVILLVFLVTSFNAFAQRGGLPDQPNYPAEFTYADGYVLGAQEAENLKSERSNLYTNVTPITTWYEYCSTCYGGVGNVADPYNSTGFIVPVTTWGGGFDPLSLMQDPVGMGRLNQLFGLRNNSSYLNGFYTGFAEHWYFSWNLALKASKKKFQHFAMLLNSKFLSC